MFRTSNYLASYARESQRKACKVPVIVPLSSYCLILTKIWKRRRSLVELTSIKFQENPFRISRSVTFWKTDRHGETNKRIFPTSMSSLLKINEKFWQKL
jgi:hypothetical protein